MQRGNTWRAAEAGADPGNGDATFSENYACSCVREHLGFPSIRKGQAKLKEKILTEIRRQGNSDRRLMAPTGKGFQGWLLVERGKSDRRVIATLLGQVFSGLELKKTQTKTS